jgi:methionine-rich copper-binding protein CopC
VTALSIQKGDEKKQTLGPLPDKPMQKVTVAVPVLPPGKYTVTYRAVSDDSHVMAGTLNFTVSASQAADHGGMDHSTMDHSKMNSGAMSDHH